jgi:beta-lactamase class A
MSQKEKEKNNQNKKPSRFLYLAITVVAFFGLGYWLGGNKNKPGSGSVGDENREVRQSGYEFINPLLECEMQKPPMFIPMEDRIKENIKNQIIEKNPDVHISLYFRNLNNGLSFGLNEQDNFSPASLLKVPLMMAYLKLSEKNSELLSQKIVFQPAQVQFNQIVKPNGKLESGKEYSIEELIGNMIVYSDNDALNMLYQNLKKDDLGVIFSDLGINMPDVYNYNNVMTVKDYASFFRILYNSSYLDRNMSEKALKILNNAEFKDGLVAGVPADVKISHKFGEREAKENGVTVQQLHDCGIVYYPKFPYLICIMTKGKDFNKLSVAIADISKIVYKEVSDKYK